MNIAVRPMSRLLRRALPLLVVLAVLFVAGLVARQVSAQGEPNVRDGEKLVTIYDRGVERTILTRAQTIRAALDDAKIAIQSGDSVEPGLDEVLAGSEYNVNIYRARPVVVVDTDGTRQRVMTSQQTPERMVKSAGIELHDEDEVAAGRTDSTLTDGASMVLAIDRATTFTFTQYGKTYTARTQATTIKGLLEEKGLKLAANDRLSAAESTPITEGMTVRLWREGKQTVTATEPVKFDVETVKDSDRPVGFREVKTAGTDGERNVTYEITVQDGVEIARTEIASVTTRAAEKQVEIVGAKLPTPTNPTEAQQIGREMMLAAGFGESEWPCLYNLWMRESGWRTTAGNPSSGAYGIPQSLPASKMAAYGDDYMTNARTQIAWGLSYVKGRYGTPCGAWNSFLSKGWY